MEREAAKVGRRGVVVIPSTFRKKYGFKEGSLIVAEAREEGVLLRPMVALPIEVYTPERKAEFLLNNVTDKGEYERAIKEVRKMGIDPKTIPHEKPRGK